MKINTSLIKGYADMTPEEKAKALEAFDMDMSGYVDKSLLDKASSEAAEFKKKWKATLDDKEKIELEQKESREALERRVAELEAEKSLNENTTRFIALGYDEKKAKETAQALIDGDMDKVFANQQAFMKAQADKIKAELLKDTPKPDAKKNDGMTLDDLKAMTLDEKQAFYLQNPDKYKELTGGQ